MVKYVVEVKEAKAEEPSAERAIRAASTLTVKAVVTTADDNDDAVAGYHRSAPS